MALQVSQSKAGEDREGREQSDLSLFIRVAPSTSGGFDLQCNIHTDHGITVLFGPSGAGKTTVLNCIAGLLRPSEGRISVGPQILFDSEARIDVPVRQRRVGYVFQNLALFPNMTAAANIEYGIAKMPKPERRNRVEEISTSLGINHLLDRKPAHLSGGEQQRVALARTLVTNPSVLLLDEPLSGLDAPTKSRIINDLRIWNDAHRIPILYVTHDRTEVFALSERVIVLDNGQVIADGTPFEALESPQSERLAYLTGLENILDAHVESLNSAAGTMTCSTGSLKLEVPMARIHAGAPTRLGIRAGDILVATSRPEGLSARNVFPGRIATKTRRDAMTVLQIDCNPMLEVHVTPQAEESLGLSVGREVWLVLKTHSCYVLRP